MTPKSHMPDDAAERIAKCLEQQAIDDDESSNRFKEARAEWTGFRYEVVAETKREIARSIREGKIP